MKTKSQSSQLIKVCEVEKGKQLYSSYTNKPTSFKEVLDKRVNFIRNKKDLQAAKLKLQKKLGSQEYYRRYKDPDFIPEGVPVRILEAYPITDKNLIDPGFHPFVGAVHIAYSQHYPLVISPDMIWLLIVQGFAIHINQNAEDMRDLFVNFKGKKLIDVRRDGFRKGSNKNDWPDVFVEFSEKIALHTSQDLVDLVTAEFSTTSLAEKVSFQVTLMDAMKSYFMYSVTTMCGIPEIIIEGTPEDWEIMEKRIEELAKYNLTWWVNDLSPILKEFRKASGGKQHPEFWQSMYKLITHGSGSSDITGWILKFFPYVKNGDSFVLRQKSKLIRTKINTEPIRTEYIYSDDLPSGLSTTEFLWKYFETFYKMEFAAGFIGCHQDSTTLAIRPEISWPLWTNN